MKHPIKILVKPSKIVSMNHYKYRLCTIMCMIFFTTFVFGQRNISGIVTDEKSGDVLIGVNVIVPGTSYGTTTDIDGKYSLSLLEDQTQLEFSYVGYETQNIELKDYNSNTISLVMKEGSILDEVVVIGYGTVKRRVATGAVTSIDSKDLNQGISASPEQLIQGRAAGVSITSASGEPGAGLNVRIRSGGSNSGITAGGQDSGFGSSSARNPLNFINPNDIQTIDILKDASATAIYGSRGANGVVLITTKKGKFNKGIEYRPSIGFSSITKKEDLLSASEFVAAGGRDEGANIDWQDEILRNAFSNNHDISLGVGDNDFDFRVGLGYSDVEGIVLNSAFQRYAATISGSKKLLNDRAKLSVNARLANTKDNYVPITNTAGFEGDLWAAALKSNPTLPVYLADTLDAMGNKVYNQPGVTEPNPLAILDYTKDIANNIVGLVDISGELDITKDLKFTSIFATFINQYSRKSAFSKDLAANGIIDKGRLYLLNEENDNRLWENYLTYDRELNNNIGLNIVAGYSYTSFNTASNLTEMTNFRTNDLDLMINNMASIDLGQENSIAPINSVNQIDELQSYFGRARLVLLDDRLTIEGSLRSDGSTKFGDGFKYGLFPAASAKYSVLSVEEGSGDLFNNLSVRVGYGVTGNQEIPHNLYTQRQRYGDYDIDNGGNTNGGGLGTVAFPNPDLKWESTKSYNIGLDFGLWDYRVGGSINYYNKNTDDLLIQVTSAQPAVSPFVWQNLDADVINRGFEIELNTYPVQTKDLIWNIGGNVSFNQNTVENFGGIINTGVINGQGLTGAFVQRIQEGQPLYAFFLREFGGYDAEGNSIYLDAEGNEGGDFQKFVDASPHPKVTMGLANSLSYKDFRLNFTLVGYFGHYIYSNTRNAFFTQGSLSNNRNVTKDVVGNGEGGLNAPDVSTRFLEKGDFARLQNVTLGYSLPVNTPYLSDIDLFVSGNNLLTFTGYSGQDPEVDTPKPIDGVPSLGIDYTSYPRAKTFIIGASVKF